MRLITKTAADLARDRINHSNQNSGEFYCGPMNQSLTAPMRGAAVAIAVAAIVACMFFFRQAIQSAWPLRKSTTQTTFAPAPSVKLARGTKNALAIDPLLLSQMGIRTAAAVKANEPTDLRLTGTLAIDSTRLQQVRSRFNGEVIALGETADQSRSIPFGDSVVPGQLLAVVWSRELGEKKSELIDAISQVSMPAIVEKGGKSLIFVIEQEGKVFA